MSEIALVSSRKSKLETAAKRGDNPSRMAAKHLANPSKFLSTVQIGITLIGLLTGIYSGQKIEDDLQKQFENIALLKPYSETLSVITIVVLLTFFSLVLGELVPKRIGLTMPEKIARLSAYPMHYLSVLTAPFIWLLTITSDLIIKLFRIRPTEDSKVTEEEIKAIIKEGTEGGEIQEIEQDIVERVFILGDRKVAALMTHRSDVCSLKLNASQEQVKASINEEMHSLYPVMNEHGDIEGIVYLKDIFRHISHDDFSLQSLLKEPKYVNENLTAYEVLKMFKSEKIYQAIVVDEFGQMDGIITLNDLLEALVGDTSEFHSTEFEFEQREDGSWLVDGQYPLHELLRKFDLEDLMEDYPFHTFSGLILHEMRKVPATGDILKWRNFSIEIVDMDGARIDKVLLRREN